jgi:uncharacterized membrane protein
MNKPPENDSAMSLGRLEAFSDGIFAVAVTLLVLNLGSLPPVGNGSELLNQLRALWPAYLGYFTTFMTVGMVWIGHHQFFRFFERIDETLLILNLLFLLFITLTPFTTGVLTSNIFRAGTGTDQVAILVYGANWLLNGLVFSLMLWYGRRHHLLKPGISDAQLTSATRNFTGSSVAIVIGLVAGFFSPPIGLLIYLGIALWHASPVLRIFSKPSPQPHSSR